MNRILHALVLMFGCAAMLPAQDNRRDSPNSAGVIISVLTAPAPFPGADALLAISNLKPEVESVRPGDDLASSAGSSGHDTETGSAPSAGVRNPFEVSTVGALRTYARSSVSDAGFRGRVPILPQVPIAFSPQTPGPDRPAQALRNKRRYWTKRRLVVMAIGFGIAGAGASLWIRGKDLPNPNYNINACRASFNSEPIPFNPDACNDTVLSGLKKAGLWMMVGGGAVSGVGFVPGL